MINKKYEAFLGWVITVLNIISALNLFIFTPLTALSFLVAILNIFTALLVAITILRGNVKAATFIHNLVRWPVILINAPFHIVILTFKEFIDFTNWISYSFGKYILKLFKL